MNASRRPNWRRRRGYHHGNLREVMIEAARQLIEQRGPGGFTLTEAARLAGVSAAAPYRHFKDREALLSEVARTGFERFADQLEDAWNGGEPSAISSFENLGRAYLRFAREEPANYAAMFEGGLSSEDFPDLRTAADRAFNVLRRACALLCQSLPEADRPPIDLMSLHIWGLSHGIATLFAEGKPTRGKVPMTPEEILESGILIYLIGLGIVPGEDAPKPGV